MADRMPDPHAVTSLAALDALYGEVNPASLAKETRVLTATYRDWLERARFFAIASAGPREPDGELGEELDGALGGRLGGGLDCSPRGDAPGEAFDVLDERTIAIPDRRGNNRRDTLRNILADPRVGLLFLIPGVGETLRINGRARITTDPALLARFEMQGTRPATVIVLAIEAVYFQCARALARSALWDGIAAPEGVPTAGQMTRSALPDFDAQSYDAALRERQRRTLY